VKRSRNDFPSFFLNFIRLIDAPDRNGAINLVSISIMAMLREKMRMATRKGTIGVGGGRKGAGCRTRELRFRTIVPVALFQDLTEPIAVCVYVDSKRRLMSAKEQFSILIVDLMGSRESPVCRVPCRGRPQIISELRNFVLAKSYNYRKTETRINPESDRRAYIWAHK